MAILNGDLKNPSKKEQKARAAKFSKEDNERVMNLQARSQSGFKGEKVNEHGLPTGPEKAKKARSKPRFDTYAKGTKSISVIDDSKAERANPRVIPPDISNLPKSETPSMRLAIKDIPEPISDSKRADMDKVRQHQTKLNKLGANLEVDGMWGDKTAKASTDLYPKYKSKAPSKSKGESKKTMNLASSPKLKADDLGDPFKTTTQTQTTPIGQPTSDKKSTMSIPKSSPNSIYDRLPYERTKNTRLRGMKNGLNDYEEVDYKQDKFGNTYYPNGRMKVSDRDKNSAGKMTNYNENSRFNDFDPKAKPMSKVVPKPKVVAAIPGMMRLKSDTTDVDINGKQWASNKGKEKADKKGNPTKKGKNGKVMRGFI